MKMFIFVFKFRPYIINLKMQYLLILMLLYV